MKIYRKIIWTTLFVGICIVVVSMYFSNLHVNEMKDLYGVLPKSDFETYLRGMLPQNNFSQTELERDYHFDAEGADVMVFLHMQKTGGTSLGRHLVRNLDLHKPCICTKKKKRCDCLTKKNTIWLFSRYSTGWACGLHADWTELKECVEDAMNRKEGFTRKRRYYFISIFRDPVKRFLSEWKHVRRGATWKTAELKCSGRSATLEEVPFCYKDESWRGVSLDDFLNCPNNLARNRQTRMLANLSKINCYNKTGMSEVERDEKMLASAKENLLDLSFFGITEFQRYTQKLFEYTFSLKFINDFVQFNVTRSDQTKITEEQKRKILDVNRLDIKLYQYAKDLFFQRVREMKRRTKDYNPIVDHIVANTFDDSSDYAFSEDQDQEYEDDY
ncbi:hypothetical protein ACJMK2_019300 [Sinanodonta woodiana]|uniref:Heparan-sulfate 6-O-sulfotransferase n=1 Tax=Sinanodonta woodiana TaxID=1069815 RepID=A0ABD3UJ26_SINWO